MAATNGQVQVFANERVRPFAEKMRAVYLLAKDHKAAMDDVYANLNDNPTWTDQHNSNPPHLMTPGDVLAFNTLWTRLIEVIEGGLNDAGKIIACNDIAAQWPVVLDACVRAPGV